MLVATVALTRDSSQSTVPDNGIVLVDFWAALEQVIEGLPAGSPGSARWHRPGDRGGPAGPVLAREGRDVRQVLRPVSRRQARGEAARRRAP